MKVGRNNQHKRGEHQQSYSIHPPCEHQTRPPYQGILSIMDRPFQHCPSRYCSIFLMVLLTWEVEMVVDMMNVNGGRYDEL